MESLCLRALRSFLADNLDFESEDGVNFFDSMELRTKSSLMRLTSYLQS
jgi:hypothetical protein